MRLERPDGVAAIIRKDLTAIRRAKAIFLPMLLVPTLLLVVLPLLLGVAAAARGEVDIAGILDSLPGALADTIRSHPAEERLVILVNGYLLAPLFLIVPLMVSAVVAADAFAGEKERRTLEGLLHQPISDNDLFAAKFLTAYVPAVAVSWIGFAAFCIVANVTAWPVLGRIFVPTDLWLVMILWVAPAVAALGIGVMIRISARAKTTQEANQLGGAVILPLIFLLVGQSTGILLVDAPVAIAIGAVVWAISISLIARGRRKFARTNLIANV